MNGLWRLALAGVVTLLATGLTAWFLRPRPRAVESPAAMGTPSATAPGPTRAGAIDDVPAVDFTDVDKAVVAAIQSAQQAVRRAPTSAEAWGTLGMTCAAHEFNEAARQAYARARRLNPHDARWPYLEARAYSLGDAEATLAPLQAAVAICGENPDAPLLTLIEALIAVGRIEEAQRRLEAFLRDHGNNARANLAMGRCQLANGDLNRAAEFTRMAEDHPATHKAANELLAQIHLRQGNKEESQRRGRMATSATSASWPDPFFEQVRSHRVGLKTQLVGADKLFAAGKVEESITVLEKAVRDYPESDWAHVLLGRSLIRARRLPEAEQVLTQALAISPQSVEAQFRLGVAIYLQKRPADAAEWFRKAVALKPDFTMAHYNLAYCLMELGDAEGAIAAFTAATASDPNHFDAHASLAMLLTKSGRWEEARTHWQRAVEIRPNDSNARRQLQRLSH